MPLISQFLSHLSPSLLRTIRLSIFLDVSRVLADIPISGCVLDLGCGYGQVVSYLAQRRPDLQFVGIDMDESAIAAARRMWSLPNLRFEIRGNKNWHGKFDAVLLMHVIHHVASGEDQKLLADAAHALHPNGKLIVEEMEYGHCEFGIFLDTYISNSPPLVRTPDQLNDLIAPLLKISKWERYQKAQIGRVYITAQKREGDKVPENADRNRTY